MTMHIATRQLLRETATSLVYLTRLRQTITAMEDFLTGETPPGPFRDLSRRLVSGAERQARLGAAGIGRTPYVDLPFEVTAAAGGDPACAAPLAAACAFVFSGLDVIDDVADGDCQVQWDGVPPAQQILAGFASVTSHAPAIIARLPLPPERIAAMQTQLGRRILLACVGQQLDLSFVGAAEVNAGEAEAAVIGKSGEQLALYCEWAATAAGATPAVVEAYAAYGRALGAAGQIYSDLSELCHDEWCRDLASGNRTLPIAYHLQRCGDGRTAFLDLLDRARTDVAVQREVRREVTGSGAVRMATITAQVHFQRARRALDEAGAREPGLGGLLEMLACIAQPKSRHTTPPTSG